MDKTTLLALAIGLAFLAFTCAAILWQLRARSIGATLRLSLGVTAAASIIWAFTNISRVWGIERIGADYSSTAVIVVPYALCIALLGLFQAWRMHK